MPHSSEKETEENERSEAKERSEDSYAESDESMAALNLGKKRKIKKKPGRRSKWSGEASDDLIDIIVNDDNFKTKLIFQNTKNQQNGKLYESILKELKKRALERGEQITFSPSQLRTKFKKCVQECKKAALTIKTATGIKRFQDSKNYGLWFNQLFAVVKTRDSCQPEQTLEPSKVPRKDEKSGENKNSEKDHERLFVPVKGSAKKKKPDNSAEAVKLLKQIAENDHSKNVIDSLRDEMEKSREHELKLFQMMCQTFTGRQQQEYSYQNMAQNATPLSTPFNQDNLQPTAFINQGFQNSLHVLQPVFQPSGCSQSFPTSLPLSSGHSIYDPNKGKSAGY